jgi:hypothetical protein
MREWVVGDYGIGVFIGSVVGVRTDGVERDEV